MESFKEVSLREEVMAALGEVGLSKLMDIQCVDVTSGVLGSHTGSRKMISTCSLFVVQVLPSFHMVYVHCITSYLSTFVSIRREDISLDALGKIISLNKETYSINPM